MPNRVEIQVIADVQNAQAALQRIPAEMKQIQTAGVPAIRAGDTALKTFNQTAVVSSRSISAATGSMRFMAVGLVSQLSPALGTTVSQFASLGTVAAASGGTLLTVAGTAGVGAVVIALGVLAANLKESRRLTEEFNAALSSFSPREIIGQIDQLIDRQLALSKANLLAAQSVDPFGMSFDTSPLRRYDEAIKALEEKVGSLRRALEFSRDTQRDAAAELAALEPAAKKAGAAVEGMGESIDAATRSLAGALLRVEGDFGGVEAAALAAGITITEELQTAIDAIKADPIHRVTEALREQRESARAAAKAHEEALKATEAAWKKNQAEIEKTADAVANVFSDTLFDALEGRITDVGDFFKRTFINAAKDVSRGMFQELSRGVFGVGRGGAGSGSPFGSGSTFTSVSSPLSLLGAGSVGSAGGLSGLMQPGLVPGTGTVGAALNVPGAVTSAGSMASFLGQIGAVVGPIFAGAGMGTMISGMMGGSQTGGMVGGLLGAGAGFLIGGPIGAMIGGALGGVIGGLFGGGAQRRAQQRQSALNQANAAIQSAFGVLRNAEITNPMVIQVVDELSSVAQLSDRISGRAEGFSAAFVALNQVASRFAAGGMSELEFLRQIRSAMFANPGTIRGGAAGTLGELIRGGFFQDVAPTLTRLMQVGAESIFREGAFQMAQRSVGLSLAQFLEVDFPSLPAGGGDGQRGFISQVMDLQTQLRDHGERLEKVEALARDILPMGFGVLGRAFEGMSATRRFQMLVNEIGLIEGERLKLAEALG